jgi:hypothetical protein
MEASIFRGNAFKKSKYYDEQNNFDFQYSTV